MAGLDDDDSNGGSDHLAEIGRQVAKALSAETISVKLERGQIIKGGFVSFNIRKKPGKKEKPASFSGSISVQTDPGVLEIDCLTVETVSAN